MGKLMIAAIVAAATAVVVALEAPASAVCDAPLLPDELLPSHATSRIAMQRMGAAQIAGER